VIAFDLATPIEILGRTYSAEGSAAYDVIIAVPRCTASAGPTTLSVRTGSVD
jgi:hypothetical protein